MRWKELYNTCNNDVNKIVTKINQPARIKSNANNFINKYKWMLLFGTISFTTLILYTFKLNVQLILASYGIMLVLLILLIYYNTFKIDIDKDMLKIDITMKQYSININEIVNIYIERKRSFIFLLIPYHYYFINILYLENKKVKGFSLSTVMLKKDDIQKFFKHFEFKNIEEL